MLIFQGVTCAGIPTGSHCRSPRAPSLFGTHRRAVGQHVAKAILKSGQVFKASFHRFPPPLNLRYPVPITKYCKPNNGFTQKLGKNMFLRPCQTHRYPSVDVYQYIWQQSKVPISFPFSRFCVTQLYAMILPNMQNL